MSDKRTYDSTRYSTLKTASSHSDTESEAELEVHSDKPAEEPLLPESEKLPTKCLDNRHKRSRRIWISALVLLLLLCIALFSIVLVLVVPRRIADESRSRWKLTNFKSVIAFGDSYSDEGRFAYLESHDFVPPPPGTLFDEGDSGVRKWVRYTIQYGGSSDEEEWSPRMTLYNYAVGGSFCTGEIVPREHPTLLEYAVPAFAVDNAANRVNTSEPFLQPEMTPTNAVFAIWIGTNDLGVFSFLTDDQVRGKLLSDFTDCVYNAIDGLYATGARTFVLMNTMPLHLAPMYANETLHGASVGEEAWRAEKIRELTTSANDIFKYQTPYEFVISHRYPDAQVALFDVWSLIREIYFHPEDYFNGTAPANVTSYVTLSDETRSSPDSYMWWDGIHPSEQTNRIIAANLIEVMDGTSKYAQYW